MDNVAQHHKRQRILRRGPREQEHICHTQNYAGDRIRHQRNAVDRTFIAVRKRATRGNQGCPISQQCAKQRCADRHNDGMGIGKKQFTVRKDISEMSQRKSCLVGPFFHHRHYKDDRKNR